jgi:hypothetical protein
MFLGKHLEVFGKTFRSFSGNPQAHSPGIINREHIGKTADELVARWNTENPNDQVQG